MSSAKKQYTKKEKKEYWSKQYRKFERKKHNELDKYMIDNDVPDKDYYMDELNFFAFTSFVKKIASRLFGRKDFSHTVFMKNYYYFKLNDFSHKDSYNFAKDITKKELRVKNLNDLL